MSPELTSSLRPRYGALELKQTYQRGLGLALLIAIVMHLAAIQGSQMYQRWSREEAPQGLTPTTRTDLLPGRLLESVYRIKQDKPPGPPPPRLKEDFKIGIPVAAGPEVADESLLATQLDIFRHRTGQSGPDGTATDTNSEIGLPQIEEAELRLPTPFEFVAVSRDPRALPNQQGPDFPEFAQLAGIEGRVILRILVGAEGEVVNVLILVPSGSDVGFEEAALVAAWKWRFIPALQNDRPVPVWMNVPVEFRLP